VTASVRVFTPRALPPRPPRPLPTCATAGAARKGKKERPTPVSRRALRGYSSMRTTEPGGTARAPDPARPPSSLPQLPQRWHRRVLTMPPDYASLLCNNTCNQITAGPIHGLQGLAPAGLQLRPARDLEWQVPQRNAVHGHARAIHRGACRACHTHTHASTRSLEDACGRGRSFRCVLSRENEGR
jgi:hypothetical protein